MKPTVSIIRSRAVYQESTTTYDDSSATFDSEIIQYGGGDTVQNLGPSNYLVDNSKPDRQGIVIAVPKQQEIL